MLTKWNRDEHFNAMLHGFSGVPDDAVVYVF